MTRKNIDANPLKLSATLSGRRAGDRHVRTIAMKNSLLILTALTVLLCAAAVQARGQMADILGYYGPLILAKDLDEKDRVDEYVKDDFSVVWKHLRRAGYLGFVGDNYQRMRLRLSSVVKDRKNRRTYIVRGKSAVNDEVKSFRGIFVIKHVRLVANMHWGCDDEYKSKGIKAQGVLIGEYKLYQDRKQRNSGYFEGVFSALWYRDKSGRIRYDNIEDYSDPYRNNQFVGSWTSYDGVNKFKCNLGDYRIPDSGDLDVGAGEFAPDGKYWENGWQSYSNERDRGVAFDWGN